MSSEFIFDWIVFLTVRGGFLGGLEQYLQLTPKLIGSFPSTSDITGVTTKGHFIIDLRSYHRTSEKCGKLTLFR